MSLNKTSVLIKPRKTGKCPDMIEKLLTGTITASNSKYASSCMFRPKHGFLARFQDSCVCMHAPRVTY